MPNHGAYLARTKSITYQKNCDHRIILVHPLIGVAAIWICRTRHSRTRTVVVCTIAGRSLSRLADRILRGDASTKPGASHLYGHCEQWLSLFSAGLFWRKWYVVAMGKRGTDIHVVICGRGGNNDFSPPAIQARTLRKWLALRVNLFSTKLFLNSKDVGWAHTTCPPYDFCENKLALG